MKILIFGGTGVIGIDLVKFFCERGDNVTVTSRSERRSEYNMLNMSRATRMTKLL